MSSNTTSRQIISKTGVFRHFDILPCIFETTYEVLEPCLPIERACKDASSHT